MKKYFRQFNLLLILCLCAFYSNSQTSKFTLNFNGQAPPGFTLSIAKAAERWANQLEITVPIKVNVFNINYGFLPFSGITFTNARKNFLNAPKQNVSYVTSLANQLAGQELNPGEYDMDVYINLASGFHFGEGDCPSDSLDLISVAMHEMGHGLGFYSAANVDANGLGSFGNTPASAILPLSTSFPWTGTQNAPTIYDWYIEKASTNPLATCAAQNSAALGDSIKFGVKYFDGPMYANTANNNQRIKLLGTNGQFNLGADLLHLDYIYTGALMAYNWGDGDTVRKPAALELGILWEIGWKKNSTVGLAENNSATKKVSVYPNPASNALHIVAENINAWRIIDQLGRTVVENGKTNSGIYDPIDVSKLSEGVYTLYLMNSDQGFISEKFVVLR